MQGSGKKTTNRDNGGLEAWRRLVTMEREGIARGGENVLVGAIFPWIRNAGKGEVSPRLEKEVGTGLECQESQLTVKMTPVLH